ncbi:MAG: DUF4290 domain-containing protein [Bacteroidetes bacterium]|nr:DUF4290 domain-containing protein [Bacteroidota bacterium]MBP7399104.1 DUF4290 domain-containing protein [Chitinophagales bacterium]MBK7108636.1 DUF4290 domain-containing protein [Bacteroidota bacterium]MBK8489040.1 DUF4290 domain-containing protein [Bacteroidota bacterium]MBK8680889.1 DUF4290 domain-containing protein [Bacteroidota bacterium]
MKEYGRNIQHLVQHAITIQDDTLRNQLVADIIDLMGTLNPNLRNVEDYRHKLWDHLFMISDFKLKAESPYPIPTRELLTRRTMELEYPRENVKFRHYGRYVESMIEKAKGIEDPEKKKEFVEIIGNYMKLVYQNWNRENVTDDIIKNDLRFLSNNMLSLDDESNLDSLSRSSRRSTQPQQKTNQNKPGKKPFRPNRFPNRNFKKNR